EEVLPDAIAVAERGRDQAAGRRPADGRGHYPPAPQRSSGRRALFLFPLGSERYLSVRWKDLPFPVGHRAAARCLGPVEWLRRIGPARDVLLVGWGRHG